MGKGFLKFSKAVVKVKVASRIVAQSEKAICFLIRNQEHWIPRSQIIDSVPNPRTLKTEEITIPKWLADKHNL